jgi:leader peptidase (prepilin peptidase)/N-methyltransferase
MPRGLILILFAPVIGSFVGVIVRRLPEGRALAWSRSRCERCGTALAARDLVPLVSWTVARGRCRYCGEAVGWFYPAIELAALAVALVAVTLDRGERVWLDCFLGWWLLALAWIDARCWVLPDALTLPLIVAGLTEAALLEPDRLLDRAAGAVFGYLLLRGVSLGYRALRDRDGLGHGDAKLLSASGAWTGILALPQVVLIAALAALAAVAVMYFRGVRMTAVSAVAFGPFIALATWSIWLIGSVI